MLNNIPPITKNLLLINVTLYIVSLVLAQQGIDLFHTLSAHYINSIFFEPYQVVTHMFMHSSNSFGHILFNMFALVVFGSYLEKVWGAKRYFIVYIASGLGAYLLYNVIGAIELYQLKNELLSSNELQQLGYQNLAQFHARMVELDEIGRMFDSSALGYPVGAYSDLNVASMLGASGAIFGLLAAFAILFPNTELYLLFIPFPVKAKYLIGGYVAFEVFNSIQYGSSGTVAHLAHVGGAIVGAAFVLYWRKFDTKNFY